MLLLKELLSRKKGKSVLGGEKAKDLLEEITKIVIRSAK